MLTLVAVAVAKVERAAVAALLKHTLLVDEALTFSHWLTNNPTALEVSDKAPMPPGLKMVWEIAYEIRSWTVQQQHKHRLNRDEEGEELQRYGTLIWRGELLKQHVRTTT